MRRLYGENIFIFEIEWNNVNERQINMNFPLTVN